MTADSKIAPKQDADMEKPGHWPGFPFRVSARGAY